MMASQLLSHNQLAAMTNQSQLTAASTAATMTSVNAAITQLAANQQAMMNQLMAYGAATADPSRACINAAVPHNVPIAQFNIPAIGSF
jgi:hypothetical protein